MKEMCEITFHVTDSTKPLASALAIANAGNSIVLESGWRKSYIENVRTGDRIMLKERGGTYVFDADCVNGAPSATSSTFSRRGWPRLGRKCSRKTEASADGER